MKICLLLLINVIFISICYSTNSNLIKESQNGQMQPIITKIKWNDINGDEIDEKIVFRCTTHLNELNHFTLEINNQKFVSKEYAVITNSFKIIDIQKSDKYKEMCFSFSDDGEDYKTIILGFIDEQFVEIGIIEGLMATTTDGLGHLIAKRRSEFLCTWFYSSPYNLSENHKLNEIPQDIYKTEILLKIKLQFSLVKSRSNHQTIIDLTPGESVTVVGCDGSEWCLVKTSIGILGWFKVDKNSVLFGHKLKIYDFVDGFAYAD